MKITVATGLYPPEIGGPATYAAMLEAELPAHDVIPNIVPFGWVRQYPKIVRHMVYAYKLWQESKNTKVMYALDPISVGLPALLIARLRRVPFLVRLGGDYAWEQGRVRFGVSATLDEYTSNPSGRPFFVRLLAAVQTFVVMRAKWVIVPSKYLQSIVVQWGVPEERIRVIYSALHPLTVTAPKETLRQQLSYTGPTIISAGRLVPWKGFSALLRVMAALQKQNSQVTLIIAGDGPLRSELEVQAAKLGIANQVRFVGRVSKEALGAAIKAADVFVLNTAYEGLSHQLIEVMDLGTPIVTTKAGGNPELITDGVNGFLVSFNDEEALEVAIRRVFEHPETCQRLIQSARLRSKQFAKEGVVEELALILHTLHNAKS